ncbi:MAG: flagellar hook-length control protein FliK [Lachnospiraceae bacterium]|nr:flagellar hook-length control protein FliK [Lachnospiraceae bacterium]
MTGTSINDLKSYFTQADTIPGIKPQTSNDDGNSFSKAMSEAQARPVNTDTKVSFQTADKNGPKAQAKLQNAGRKDLNPKAEKADGAVKDSGDASDQEIRDRFSEKLDKIKKAIEDELGITDEELVNAMETLGLSQADLLDPDSVKALMMDITGTENAVDLLTDETLLSGINNVCALVNESIEGLREELSVTDDQFAGLVSRFEELVSNDDIEEMPGEALAEGLLKGEGDTSDSTVNGEKPVEDRTVGAEAVNSQDVKSSGKSENAEAPEKPDIYNVQNTQTPAKASKNGNSFEQSGGNRGEEAPAEQLQMPQTVVQTQVNEAGEVVETVRYSSYAENAEIVNQVTEQIKINISPESTSMEMMLHPASLGAVNIQVTQQGDILRAQILVQNEQVKDAIAGQMEQLLKTFEEQGQKVTEIDVSVANYNLEHGLNQGQDQNSSSNGNRGSFEESSSQGGVRRTIDLNAMSEEEISELDENDRLTASVMSMTGTSVEYRA